MLWWGMDETLAELFARHPSARDFDGNPPDRLRADIADNEYEAVETPVSIGLYGGRYTIPFYPGECSHAVHMCASVAI